MRTTIFSEIRQYAQFNAAGPKIGRPRRVTQNHEQKAKYEDLIIWAVDFKRALEKLEPEDRTCLLLAEGAGFSEHQIEQMTGISKRKISRCRARGISRLAQVRSDQRQGRCSIRSIAAAREDAAERKVQDRASSPIAPLFTPLAEHAKAIHQSAALSQHITLDGPACKDCGAIMIPAGTCHRCMECGGTSGCG